jgi:hypothetical protein
MAPFRTFALVAFFAAFAAANAQEVGSLTVVRQVKVTRTAVNEGQEYVDARNGQRVRNHYGLRTLRRSRAQINFDDKSVLRVNERTDMVVEDTESLRRIQLGQGAVWVRVAKGRNTTVETPTATATARGTEFEVRANGDLLVYEGVVDLTIGGRVISVSAGQKVTFGNDGKPSDPTALSPAETPSSAGGGTKQWFDEIEGETGNKVSSESEEFQQLRTDPVNEDARKAAAGGSDLTVIIRGNRAPGIDPKRDLPLIDDTETSYFIPALALGASLAADWDKLQLVHAPAVRGSAFAFAGTPAFAGFRGNVEGGLGDSRYSYEMNVIKFLHEPETNVLGRFGSVLYLERPLNEDLKIFAGRRRFYHGPVFNDAVDTQLIANRFSSVGFRWDKKALSVEGAYVYDANRYVSGAQTGGLGSIFYRAFGGVVGAHVLETKGIAGGNHGRAVSASMPLIPKFVDGYGEFGTGIDGTVNETLGAYLPGVFQKTGVDVFIEYGRKRGVQQAYSLTGLYTLPKGPKLRGSLEWIEGRSRLNAGVVFRF